MAHLPDLRLSDDRRHFRTADGEPFFYLGDTAWELFHRLSFDQAEHYLTTRAEQGFTAYQAVLLGELDGLGEPNANGDTPLIDEDPARPDERYFQHVDRVVDRGAELGLYAALLPTWGDKVNPMWATKSRCIFTPDSAATYARYLAHRYRDRPVIWVLGGDRPIDTPEQRAIYRAMGRTLKDENPHQLVTFHPMGATSSVRFVHQERWLDFNMFQSGHGERDAAVWDYVIDGRAQTPVRPVFDGEPCYEDHPVMGPGWRAVCGWFDEYDVRKAAYRSVFSGAAGHTYGAHPVWMMYEPHREPINRVRRPWTEALSLPGAQQMRHLRDLWLSLPFTEATPGLHWLHVENPAAPHQRDRRLAGMWRQGEFAAVYCPVLHSLRPNLTALDLAAAKLWWFNPRTGEPQAAVWSPGTPGTPGKPGEPVPPPADMDASIDWVLIVDRADRDAPPGATR